MSDYLATVYFRECTRVGGGGGGGGGSLGSGQRRMDKL